MQHVCGDIFDVEQRYPWIQILEAFPELKVLDFLFDLRFLYILNIHFTA
jgi:hypothetical protein